MVYTDGIHLVSRNVEELHQFASYIGLKRIWFQDKPRFPHYDLTTVNMARRAVLAGAEVVTGKSVLLVARKAEGDNLTIELIHDIISFIEAQQKRIKIFGRMRH